MKKRGWEYDIRALKSEIIAEDKSLKVKLSGVISEIKDVGPYDLVLATSGEPTRKWALCEDINARRLIAEQHNRNKWVGSICATVPILKDIANGARVTCYNSYDVMEVLQAAGAILEMRSILVDLDKKIVTAQAPPMAEMWVEVCCDCVEGKDTGGIWLSQFEYKQNMGYYHKVSGPGPLHTRVGKK